MSATGLEVFDTTIQKTHIWLDEIMDEIGPDRHVAWHVLGVVLRAIRDRVPMELGAHLGAQLPLMIRGTYFEQYRPRAGPDRTRSMDDFVEHVHNALAGTRPINARLATYAVFRCLSRHLDPGQVAKVLKTLPEDIRRNWVAATEDLRSTQPELMVTIGA